MERTHQKLETLLALWYDHRGNRALPARGDFPVRALRPWLGNLALIDLEHEGGVAFRLCGTNLHSRFGGEMTRRRIADLADEFAGPLRHCIEEVCGTGKPNLQVHERVGGGRTTLFCDLCVPLANDGAHMDTLLFASYPVGK